MNLQRVIAVAHKEWREIVRDRLFFALAFIIPTVLMLMFGFGLSLDVENIPMAIVDQDGSALSRDYAHRFIDSRYFHFLGYSHNERELTPLLTDNTIRAAIIIPEHFGADLLAGRPAQVQTLIDGTFP
ncbi:MAG: ABC transporter permease, partial [Verrucomicrobia bacterium]|nr:ABC transporter permease [Verrucomicrobiota bacterium]